MRAVILSDALGTQIRSVDPKTIKIIIMSNNRSFKLPPEVLSLIILHRHVFVVRFTTYKHWEKL